jgi:hypothetical protein
MSERPPCKCHGSWPLHADDQAAALRKLGLENDRIESQNQALRERIEKLERQLKYAARPTMGLPPNTDPMEWARNGATDKAVRDALVTCIVGATRALSPTQETDPE